MNKIALLTFFCLCFSAQAKAQKTEYKIAVVGFYNLENLFDTLDTPNKFDEEFTPKGSYNYNSKIYYEKLHNLSSVVSEIGTDITPDGLAILGVSEIENRAVLEDFVKQPSLADRNYEIVHYESPDRRGIDNALLYNPKYFQITSSRKIPFGFPDIVNKKYKTRDILFVSGVLDGEPLHVLVNHWPSRSGGESTTAPMRNHAASLCKAIVDSLTIIDPNTKVIVMGDLNDDPVSPSVKKILKAKPKKESIKEGEMYNPMYEYFKKGIGTNAYRDAWSNFDQLIFTKGLLDDDTGFRFLTAKIFKKPYMLQKTGQYKGYPKRAYSFSVYSGGYSDHFPVYSVLVKPVTK